MRSTFNMSVIDWIALVIVFVGALNWGLIGLAHFLTDAANWNLVNQLFGGSATVEFGIYLVVGLAALWTIYFGSKIAGVASSLGRDRPRPDPEA